MCANPRCSEGAEVIALSTMTEISQSRIVEWLGYTLCIRLSVWDILTVIIIKTTSSSCHFVAP
jgi:hypothetical protein